MKNIRHHLLAFAFITLTIVVGKSVLHPPIAHAQGNNCCSDGAWIWQHVGGSCEDTEWQRGYDACLQKQCGVCQSAAVRDNGICESGENEGTHPLDCAPGGGNYVAPASSGGGSTAVSTAGNVCFDGAPTASACRGGKKDGDACTGFDGTCIANGTNTSGATLCGCRPKQIVACDNVPNSTNNYNATAVCVGGTSCNAYGRNSSNGGNGCQAGYVCCSKVVSFTPTASSAPVYGSNNQQTLPVTSPTTTNATNLATANQQLINGAPSVRVEITTSTGQTVSVLQVPNRHCQGDTVTDTCSVNQICTLGANGYVCMTPSQAALVTIATNTYVSAVGCGQQGTSTDPATKQFLCGNQCNWVGEIVRTGQTCGGARSSSIVTPVPPTLTACSSPNQCMPTAACSDLGGSTVANRTCSSGNICCSKTAPQVVVTPQPATGRALNQDCTSDSQCTSLYCAPISSTNPDKVCTVRPTPAMSACRAGETVFTPVVSGGAVDPNASRCSSTVLVTAYQCNVGFTYTSGACRKVLGQRCTQSVECASNSCEGVCTELVQTVLCTRSMLPGTASPSTAIPQNASVCRTSDNVLHFQCNAGYILNTVSGVSSCVLPTQVGVATVTYPSCVGLRSKLTRSVDISSPVPIGAEICSESSTQLRYQCDSQHTASVTGNECLLIGARVQVSTPIPSPTATPTPVSTPTPGPVCGTFSDTGCNDGKARKGDACVNSSGQKGTCTARLEFAGYLNCECKPLPTTSPSTSTTTTTTTENLMKTSIPIAVATPVPTSKITTNESATQKGLNEPCAVLSAGDLQGNCQSTLRCILDQYGRFCRPIPTPSPTPKGYGARCIEGERCATNLSCVNSLCRRINGQQCATGGECVSGNCQSGVCQNATPTPTATPRSTVAPCTTPNRCVGSGVCSRSGVQAQSCPTSGGQTQVCCSDKGVVGTSCVSGEQCHSGYCDLSDGPSRGVCTTPITCTRSVGELTTQAGSNRERCTNPNNTSGTWYQCVTGTTGRQVGATFECSPPVVPTPSPTLFPISATCTYNGQCASNRCIPRTVGSGSQCSVPISTLLGGYCSNPHGTLISRENGIAYFCCLDVIENQECRTAINTIGVDIPTCSRCEPASGLFANNQGCGRCPNDEYHQEADGRWYCGPSTRVCRPRCIQGTYSCNADGMSEDYCQDPFTKVNRQCGVGGCNATTGRCNACIGQCIDPVGNLSVNASTTSCGEGRRPTTGSCSNNQVCCTAYVPPATTLDRCRADFNRNPLPNPPISGGTSAQCLTLLRNTPSLQIDIEQAQANYLASHPQDATTLTLAGYTIATPTPTPTPTATPRVYSRCQNNACVRTTNPNSGIACVNSEDCRALKANNQSCSVGSECQSGYCARGGGSFGGLICQTAPEPTPNSTVGGNNQPCRAATTGSEGRCNLGLTCQTTPYGSFCRANSCNIITNQTLCTQTTGCRYQNGACENVDGSTSVISPTQVPVEEVNLLSVCVEELTDGNAYDLPPECRTTQMTQQLNAAGYDVGLLQSESVVNNSTTVAPVIIKDAVESVATTVAVAGLRELNSQIATREIAAQNLLRSDLTAEERAANTALLVFGPSLGNAAIACNNSSSGATARGECITGIARTSAEFAGYVTFVTSFGHLNFVMQTGPVTTANPLHTVDIAEAVIASNPSLYIDDAAAYIANSAARAANAADDVGGATDDLIQATDDAARAGVADDTIQVGDDCILGASIDPNGKVLGCEDVVPTDTTSSVPAPNLIQVRAQAVQDYENLRILANNEELMNSLPSGLAGRIRFTYNYLSKQTNSQGLINLDILVEQSPGVRNLLSEAGQYVDSIPIVNVAPAVVINTPPVPVVTASSELTPIVNQIDNVSPVGNQADNLVGSVSDELVTGTGSTALPCGAGSSSLCGPNGMPIAEYYAQVEENVNFIRNLSGRFAQNLPTEYVFTTSDGVPFTVNIRDLVLQTNRDLQIPDVAAMADIDYAMAIVNQWSNSGTQIIRPLDEFLNSGAYVPLTNGTKYQLVDL